MTIEELINALYNKDGRKGYGFAPLMVGHSSTYSKPSRKVLENSALQYGFRLPPFCIVGPFFPVETHKVIMI